jgi:DNA polymerase I-like protein with 3'-5' exonuclease and polymerase domains
MKVLSYDLETRIGNTVHGSTFRDPQNDFYTLIYSTNPEWVSIIHNPTGFKRVLDKKFEEELYYADVLIGHNLSFDLCYVWNNKSIQDFVLKGGKIWDTQTAEYILTGQQHSTSSLAELQDKYLGVIEKPSRISALYKKGVGADRIVQASNRCKRLFKLYEQYCKTDGSTPLKIFKAQYLRAKKEGMLAIVELYNDYLLSIINMTCTGVDVDVAGAEELHRDFTLKHLEYLQEAQNILSGVWTDSRLPTFNINSTVHKSAVLFGGLVKARERVQTGYYKPKPIYETLEGGRRKRVGMEEPEAKFKQEDIWIDVVGYKLNPNLSRGAKKDGLYSTDDKVLKAIKADKETPKEVLQYCEMQELSMKYKKAANTYCLAIIDRNVNGVLHPNFNNTITPTGRLTSSQPNLQNLPSKGDLAEAIMGLWIAPKGWTCVSIDFSQLEKWVQALVSQDSNLIEMLEKGTCLHCMTLAKMEGLDYEWVYNKAKVEKDPVWDKKRTHIKPVGFLMDYGGMPKRVALETGLSLEQVEDIYRIDKELYPDKHRFFEVTVPLAVEKSATFSLACNIPKNKKKGVKGGQMLGKAELLPIYDNSKNKQYNKGELRRVGYWQTNYGKKYHFLEDGRINKFGIRRSFSLPKFKNYPNQGNAADVQAITTASLLNVLTKGKNSIRMINEIHDSKLFYIRNDKLAGAIKWLVNTIEDVPKLFKERFGIEIPFKFPVEVETGDNFGKMRAVKLIRDKDKLCIDVKLGE